MNLENRKAIVLGGTSGIGLETALQLKSKGAEVIAVGRSEGNLETAAAAGLTARQCDVLDEGAMQALFEEHAPFDALVCAATGGSRANGPFLQMDMEGYRGSFAKLWGYANAVRYGALHLSDDGAIVLVSGAPARRATPGSVALSSVGGAVEALCRATAKELAPRRINVVSPGIIDTPMFAVPEEQREAFLSGATKNFIIPRAGKSDEVAQAILFTIENDFVTGTTVDVDGGWLLS